MDVCSRSSSCGAVTASCKQRGRVRSLYLCEQRNNHDRIHLIVAKQRSKISCVHVNVITKADLYTSHDANPKHSSSSMMYMHIQANSSVEEVLVHTREEQQTANLGLGAGFRGRGVVGTPDVGRRASPSSILYYYYRSARGSTCVLKL